MRIIKTVKVTPQMPRLICTMDTGDTYDLDISDLLSKPGPMIEPLRSPEYFAQAYVGEAGQVTWPNGFDLDPSMPAECGRKIQSSNRE